jgi:hypothetical protein
MYRIVYHYVDGTQSKPSRPYSTLYQAIGLAEIRINQSHVSNTTHPVAYVQIIHNKQIVWDSRFPA